MSVMRRALLWGSTNEWLAGRLPRYRFVQRAVRRFMPGEELESALLEAAQLAGQGASTIVTRLGENVTAADETASLVAEYVHAYAEAVTRGLDTQVSIKLTQLGIDFDEELALANCDELATAAAERGSMLWIDMESSAYTDVTLGIFRRLRDTHDNVGVCLQSYLYRTGDDLAALLALSPAIRLVKGAYMEPPELAFPAKRDVDDNYLKLARTLLRHIAAGEGGFVGFGTHDRGLIARLRAEASVSGVSPDGYEFEMLYGIGGPDQKRLLADGCPLRVLISYGDAWFPWYMRRLAERPANVGFVLRSMVAR